jgi:hypothetical protein
LEALDRFADLEQIKNNFYSSDAIFYPNSTGAIFNPTTARAPLPMDNVFNGSPRSTSTNGVET